MSEVMQTKVARVVTHDEARAAAQRFIDGHFNNPGERPRISIPADLERDDDVLLMDYIEQQCGLERERARKRRDDDE